MVLYILIDSLYCRQLTVTYFGLVGCKLCCSVWNGVLCLEKYQYLRLVFSQVPVAVLRCCVFSINLLTLVIVSFMQFSRVCAAATLAKQNKYAYMTLAK